MQRQHLAVATMLLVALGAAPATTEAAASWAVVGDDTVFAVVTHKAGFAAGLAHNHLVAPADYDVTLEFSPADPASAGFEIAFAAESLTFDDPQMQARWGARIRELGVLDGEFSALPDSRREQIRQAALGPRQIDAASHPLIAATIIGVTPAGDAPDGGAPGDDEPAAEFPWRVSLAFEVHGVRVERPVRARYAIDESGGLEIEAVGRYAFSDFGIKPYSAMLGAVRNRDEFELYVHLRAVPAAADEAQ